jgi:hypothetical protein
LPDDSIEQRHVPAITSSTGVFGFVSASLAGMMIAGAGWLFASIASSMGRGFFNRRDNTSSAVASIRSNRSASVCPIRSRRIQRRSEATQSRAVTFVPSWNQRSGRN